ncbi:MAG: efflux RND transporter periplasmic adaptor subunit [Candidatus Acidiferrales bacterium]|jgi:RND family efflux transporter MFP subunit
MSEPAERSLTPSQPGVQPHHRGHGWLILFLVVVIVALVVIGGILPRVHARDVTKKETDQLAKPTVIVQSPKQSSSSSEIVLPGNMQAFIDAPIYARTNGYLQSWYFDIGARVKKGQLLAIIDTPEVDQQLSQARADLNTAQANFALSGLTEQRYQDLKSTDAVSKQDVDNAHGDFESKKAQVSSAQANVKRLEDLQSFTRIYAPFDGVITARNTDIGQLIDSGSGTPAKELFHIAAINTLRVYINVPQQYSTSAKPGLTADLTLAQFPGRTFQGHLVRTANAIDLATRTLLVEVDVENKTGELLPGAYVQVHLKTPNAIPAYTVPVSALIFRSAGLQVGVVDGNNKASLVSVTPGRDFGNEIEIITGLNAGDKVIINPPDSLIQGEDVQIVQPPAQNNGPQNQQASQPQQKPGGQGK